MAQEAYPEQEDTANRQAIEAFVHALDLKLALEVQKLGHHTLEDVISVSHRIEHLQKDCVARQTPSGSQGVEGFRSCHD